MALFVSFPLATGVGKKQEKAWIACIFSAKFFFATFFFNSFPLQNNNSFTTPLCLRDDTLRAHYIPPACPTTRIDPLRIEKKHPFLSPFLGSE